MDCYDINDAHKLSAHVFWVQSVRHFKAAGDRGTDYFKQYIYEEEPADPFRIFPNLLLSGLQIDGSLQCIVSDMTAFYTQNLKDLAC